MAERAAKLAAVAALGAGGLYLWARARAPEIIITPKPAPDYEPFGPDWSDLVAAGDPVTIPDLILGEQSLSSDPATAAAQIGFLPLYSSLEVYRRVQSGLASIITGGLEMQPTDPSAPRGIRNHNPGNIKNFGIPWQGMVAGDDPVFVTFAAPEWGIRAIFKTLDTYQRRHGLTTIREMISRWAPAGADGNHTANYIAHVARKTGLGPDEPVDLGSEFGLRMVAAMIEFENGTQPYAAGLLDKGRDMAGIA